MLVPGLLINEYNYSIRHSYIWRSAGMFLPNTPSQGSAAKPDPNVQHALVTQRQWRLGAQLRGVPGVLMVKLHDVLRANNVMWRKLGPYSLRYVSC